MKICLLVFLLGKNAPQLNSLFETAVRRVAVDQVSFTNIIRNVEVSDEQDMQAFILEKTFYFLDRICPLLIPSPVAPVRVIMTAGSSETEASLLVDIGREENVVVMSLTRRSPSLLDRGRSPTLVQLPTFRIGNSSSISQTQVGEAFFGSMQLLAQLSTRADRCSRSGQGGQTAANLVQCLRNMLEKSSHFYNFTLPSDPLTLERLLVGSWSSPQQNLSEEHSEQSTTASYGPQNSDDTSSVNAVAAVFGVILGMIIVISFARMWQKLHRFANLAWVIDERKMEYVRTWIPTIGRWAVPIEKGSMQGVVMVYDGRITTTSVSFPFYVDFHTVKKHQLAKLVLKLMRDIDHPNVCKFYGIMWTTNHHIYGKSMVYVAEHTTKGFLRHVIDDDSLALNWDLRFCLMWDLFLGLKYVHRSKLRCHGCLTSICAYVDERFTLKLAGTGILPYMAVLVRSHPEQLKPRDDYFGPVMNMQRLWMAPEVVADIRQSFTKAADTYSFGVILYEMSTRNAPFNVALCDEVEFEDVARKMGAGTFDPTQRDLGLDSAPVELAALMYSCWARKPDDRPDLNSMLQTLTAVYPQRSGMSFGDSIIDRLIHYSNELEAKVALQTESLIAEASRVDNLLCDLLPYDIVRRLRRAEDIDLEYCDSVTVMFSDVPIFSEIVGKVSPFQLFAMLEHMCRRLDAVVDGFTVFKVETIRDSYMVVGGVPVHIGNRHAVEVANLALAMMDTVRSMPTEQDYQLQERVVLEARAGMHSGPVVAGIIGTKLPHYTIFGDTVNTASRMATSGETSRIQISTATCDLLKGRKEFVMESRGRIPIKGKGVVETFWLTSSQGNCVSISDMDFFDEPAILVGKPSTKHYRKLRHLL